MTMPTNGTPFPPRELVPAYEAIKVYDTWLAGDPQKMQEVFAESAMKPRAGLLGRLKLPFWGSPNPTMAQTPPAKVHVPIAANIARMSADQVFGQLFKVEFVDDHDSDDQATKDTKDPAGGAQKPTSAYDKATARANELLDDYAHAALMAAGELASAHGGAFLKVAWDKDVAPDGPFLVAVGADCALPTFKYGRLTSVAFWTKLDDRAGNQYMLLEDHSPGRVEFALFESNERGMIGNRVPLTSHPDATQYADLVDAESGYDTGSDLLTAVYLPNRRPNPQFRKDPIAQHFGRSDYSGAESAMDLLDGWYTSWDRDFRLGRARLIVPRELMQLAGPGAGATFNADQEVFTELGDTVGSLNPDGTSGTASPFLKEFQPAIRWQEHLNSIEHLTERIYATAGFSAQSFGEGGDVAITATEVASRAQLTFQSRSAKVMAATPPLVALIAALMDVDEAAFSGPGRAGIMPNIEWPDAIGEDPEVLARTIQALNLSESTSLETRVRMLHKDWDDGQVAEEVNRIKEETALMPVPTEKTLWGTNTNGPDDPTQPGTQDAPIPQPAPGQETVAKTPPGTPGGGTKPAPMTKAPTK